MNYKTYAEAKIANPDCEIVTTGKGWMYDKELIGTFEPRVTEGCSHAINDYSWVICNPADYCSTLKEFLDSGFKLADGDMFIGANCSVITVVTDCQSSIVNALDSNRYILLAAALNGGCKLPAKYEQWTVYNNTLPLSELNYEQAGRLVKHSGEIEHMNKNTKEWGIIRTPTWNHCEVYRAKQKSERDLFIDASMQLMTSETERTMEQMFGVQFDAGARYKDLTQFFGENI